MMMRLVINESKGNMTFQQDIWWTVPGLGRVFVPGPVCETPSEALKAAKELAWIMGWRRPRWNDWRRWRDEKYDKVKRIKLTPTAESK